MARIVAPPIAGMKIGIASIFPSGSRYYVTEIIKNVGLIAANWFCVWGNVSVTQTCCSRNLIEIDRVCTSGNYFLAISRRYYEKTTSHMGFERCPL